MAERSSHKKAKKTRTVKSCGPAKTTNVGDDFLTREEHYKFLNAEIEAKTADLERQTELFMREQNDVLSKTLSTVHLTDFEEYDDDDDRKLTYLQDKSGLKPCVKVTIKQQTSLKTNHTGKQLKDKPISEMSSINYFEALEEGADTFLAKTIQKMEDRMDEKDSVKAETAISRDSTAAGVSNAQVRVFKAKLQIMQEELDQLTNEYYKKDDENIRLNAKIKELEEDCARLQKTQSIQQTQIERHKAFAEESAKKCEGLQSHVAGLSKEIENLNRLNKQTAALHNTAEIRLNRAMEESQKLKNEINKMKQRKKDKVNEEHESKESLLTENKSLKKQKAELIVAFKKQLKLIDILKRQKMHFEAAKLLSFTEEEFIKALDWGELLLNVLQVPSSLKALHVHTLQRMFFIHTHGRLMLA